MLNNDFPAKIEEVKLTPKDFQSSAEVKWCAGCGDFSMLAQIQRTSPHFGVKKEDFVWVSGIGCSSRFPYYMDTFGFHGIHGRAPAIASGVKIANPKLSVWIATGDGDLLSIGGNHFIHACRRNLDFKVLLFNNKIYGLTKGQYSPTSEKGKKTKSSPYGAVDYPFEPTALALGAGATFIARSIDRDGKHLQEMMNRAAVHVGTAFIEVYQNCVIFNDGTYSLLTDKETKLDHSIILEHGKPMIFGNTKDKGIKLDGFNPTVVSLSDVSESELWIHDEKDENPIRAYILAQMTEREALPTPFGVFRDILKPSYDSEVEEQIEKISKGNTKRPLSEILGEGNTWVVE